MLKWNPFGEMAERFKAPVLKTGLGQLNVGSNPSLSAEQFQSRTFAVRLFRNEMRIENDNAAAEILTADIITVWDL